MKLNELLQDLPYEIRGDGNVEISALCTDSRVSSAGDLFFCFRGGHADSHTFAEEAQRRGVAAVVCERALDLDIPQVIAENGREAMAQISAAFYGHPEKAMKIVGITGTNGKTTTSFMLHAILEEAGIPSGVIGTLGARYADRTVAPDLTTPDPVYLFSLLSDMREAGVQVVVMEVSAHALALDKVSPICFEEAIFTNLTQDHLDFFHSMEEYGNAKRLLFQKGRAKLAILNADDQFSAELTAIPAVTYGLENPADSFAVIGGENERGSRVVLNLSDDLCECTVKMTGRHNVYNALAAATAARAFGVSPEKIAQGLSAFHGVDGRLEWVASYKGADIFVDYAHTPDGLEKSLLALRKFCKGRLVCLFGCGGNRDTGKRARMGETAARLSDFSILTSDNPRYEDPCTIIAQIEEGYQRYSKRYVAVQDREKGTQYALNFLEKGDVLLVAGKGGETYQEIMGIKYAYNDKAVIEALIGGDPEDT